MVNIYKEMDVNDKRHLRVIIGNSNSYFTARDRVGLLRKAYAGGTRDVTSLVSTINHEGSPSNVAYQTLQEICDCGYPLNSYLQAVKDTFDAAKQQLFLPKRQRTWKDINYLD